MPGIYRHAMRQGIAARARLHTAEYDLDRLTLHCIDLERTLYRLATTICLDKLVDMDHEAGLATPNDETATYLGDYYTQAQMYAALQHAGELTAHLCESCEGRGGEDVGDTWRECLHCNGTGEVSERVTTEDRIRAIMDRVKPTDVV